MLTVKGIWRCLRSNTQITKGFRIYCWQTRAAWAEGASKRAALVNTLRVSSAPTRSSLRSVQGRGYATRASDPRSKLPTCAGASYFFPPCDGIRALHSDAHANDAGEQHTCAGGRLNFGRWNCTFDAPLWFVSQLIKIDRPLFALLLLPRGNDAAHRRERARKGLNFLDYQSRLAADHST
jgi:hypothetical protein